MPKEAVTNSKGLARKVRFSFSCLEAKRVSLDGDFNHWKLLFLTVDPGYYGGTFQAHVLKKIEEARKISPDKVISVDGGVSLDNLSLFKDIGVDAVCVGSRIFLGGIPEENYMKFINRMKELEGNESI